MKVHTIINSILRSCTYILYNESTSEVYLIDCGDVEPIIQFIERQGKVLKGVFLTHCHYDHVYGLNEIMSRCKDVVIYASAKTVEGLHDPRINLSKYHGNIFICEPPNLSIINETTTMYLNNHPLTVIESNGHDEGCLSYLIDNALFTGDSYIPLLPVFTKWKRSNKIKAADTESKLKGIANKNLFNIYPGHSIHE